MRLDIKKEYFGWLENCDMWELEKTAFSLKNYIGGGICVGEELVAEMFRIYEEYEAYEDKSGNEHFYRVEVPLNSLQVAFDAGYEFCERIARLEEILGE